MLLVRSLAAGVSHSPDEHTDPQAIADAIAVLGTAVRELGDS